MCRSFCDNLYVWFNVCLSECVCVSICWKAVMSWVYHRPSHISLPALITSPAPLIRRLQADHQDTSQHIHIKPSLELWKIRKYISETFMLKMWHLQVRLIILILFCKRIWLKSVTCIFYLINFPPNFFSHRKYLLKRKSVLSD